MCKNHSSSKCSSSCICHDEPVVAVTCFYCGDPDCPADCVYGAKTKEPYYCIRCESNNCDRFETHKKEHIQLDTVKPKVQKLVSILEEVPIQEWSYDLDAEPILKVYHSKSRIELRLVSDFVEIWHVEVGYPEGFICKERVDYGEGPLSSLWYSLMEKLDDHIVDTEHKRINALLDDSLMRLSK